MSTRGLSRSSRLSYLALLSESETQRYQRFVDLEARDQFLIGRAMLRLVLSQHAQVAPRDWVFGVNDYGRPFVVAPQWPGLPCFNLSHTRGVVVLVLSDVPEIGVDVEHVGRSLAFDDLAAGVFSPEERTWLRDRGGEPSERDAFYKVWTMREAYAKARGMGFSLPSQSFSIDFDQGVPQLRCHPSSLDQSDRWRLLSMRLPPDYMLAVARAQPASPGRTCT